jgi:hypothetical protein
MAKMESMDGDNVTFALEKPLSVLEGDECLFIREALPRIFASGKIIKLL